MTSDAARAVDRRLVALAVPALFTLAAEPLYVLADTAIIGHLGTPFLAGLGLASIVLFTAAGLCNVLTWGTTSRVGFLKGAGDDNGVARVAATVLVVAVAVGAGIAAVVVLTATPVLRALGGDGEVLAHATTYLRIGALGLPALLITWAGQGVARGEGDTRGPLLVVIAANVLNLVLEVWFVYGLDWSIAGSAWGTVVAQWSGAAVLAARLARRAGGLGAPDPHEVRHIARVGATIVVRTGALLCALTAASSIAARISATALAAHQVVSQLNLFCALVLDAAAIAAQAMVAEAVGAGDAPLRALIVRRSLRLTLIGSAVMCGVLLLGFRAIPGLFVDDRSVVNAAAAVMPILAFAQFPGGVAYIFDGLVMGQGHFTTAMWSTLAGLVPFAAAGTAVLLRPSLGLGVLWLGLAAWLVVRAAVNASGLAPRGAPVVPVA